MGETAFRQELSTLINRHSKENASDTPDFILADYLANCLISFDTALIRRQLWYAKSERDKGEGP